jgi:hypothetical protein
MGWLYRTRTRKGPQFVASSGVVSFNKGGPPESSSLSLCFFLIRPLLSSVGGNLLELLARRPARPSRPVTALAADLMALASQPVPAFSPAWRGRPPRPAPRRSRSLRRSRSGAAGSAAIVVGPFAGLGVERSLPEPSVGSRSYRCRVGRHAA